MAIVRWKDDLWSPTEELDRLQREISQLFDYPETRSGRGIFDRSSSPALDVAETDEGFEIYCDLPGIDEKDLELSITNGVVTIKGERKPLDRDKDGKMYRSEMWAGKFQRTLSLPAQVDADKIEAELANGVLHIFVPKMEEIKPKQIELKVK
jgi:HSP20 family protein